jgi:hypothetical protein
MESSTAQHPLVGSWLATVASDGEQVQYLFTFSSDANCVVSGPIMDMHDPSDPHAIGNPVGLSTGHGTWVSRGPSNAELNFTRLANDGQGKYLGRRETWMSIALAPEGDSWEGQFILTVFVQDGELPKQGTGVLSAARIPTGKPDLNIDDNIKGPRP